MTLFAWRQVGDLPPDDKQLVESLEYHAGGHRASPSMLSTVEIYYSPSQRTLWRYSKYGLGTQTVEVGDV